MSRFDFSFVRVLSNELVDQINDYGGHAPEEAIPALVQAIVILADGDDQLLDEAANFLADGGLAPYDPVDEADY